MYLILILSQIRFTKILPEMIKFEEIIDPPQIISYLEPLSDNLYIAAFQGAVPRDAL